MSRDPQINIRIPQELKDAVQALAEANKRSVNAELVAAIEFWTAAAQCSSRGDAMFVGMLLNENTTHGKLTAKSNIYAHIAMERCQGDIATDASKIDLVKIKPT